MQMGNPFMGLPIFKNNNAKKHINMTELEKAQTAIYTMQTMIIKCRLLRLKVTASKTILSI